MSFNTFIRTNTLSVKSFLSTLSSRLLPSACALCGAPAETVNLCLPCLQGLPILPHHCPQCAHFLPAASQINTPCGKCIKQPPPFDRTFALFPYQFPVISLITQLKFHRQLSHAALFGRLLANQIQHHWYMSEPLPDLLLPIPLHHSRLQERGFNQAGEIAKHVSNAIHVPRDLTGITRCKSTAAQRTLSAKQRKLNIQGAFIVNRSYAGRHIAVIDDVITTGQTVFEVCRLLRQQGAERIDIWCSARNG